MHPDWFCSGLVLGGLLVLAGCGSDDNDKALADAKEISEADAKQKAVTYAPGTAGAVEHIETATEHRWAVTVTMSNGAEVSVELERSNGAVDEITSQKGPFECELPAAGAGLVLYSKARSLALEAKQGQIEAWEVDVPGNYWEFYVREPSNTLWEIKMNAQTGAMMSTEQKAQRD